MKKETPTQLVFCEFCGIFKNTFFKRIPQVAASVIWILLMTEVYLRHCQTSGWQTNMMERSGQNSKSWTLTFQKIWFDLLQWKSFKNGEECFLFHAKSSFCSLDIYIFVLSFWLCRKQFDKKAMVNFKIYGVIEWTTKVMTSQTGQQIITMQVLPNIAKSKANQTIKFSHLIEQNMRQNFLEKLNTKCGG